MLLVTAVPVSATERLTTFEGTIAVEVRNDGYRSEAEENGNDDLHFTIEPALSLLLVPRLSLEAGLVVEPVTDPRGRTRDGDDHGLFVEQLFLQYATERWGIRAGKVNPHFGIAWEAAPGIFGADFAEDYQVTERLGAGGFLVLGSSGVGMHALATDVFVADTTFLSRSAGIDRGRTRRSDGGPSNTAAPCSFSVSLTGAEMPPLPGLGYHLDFLRQAAGRHGERDEYGGAVGLGYGFSPSGGIDAELLSEYVWRGNVHGGHETCHDLVQGVALRWLGWNLALVHALRSLDPPAGRARGDHLVQVSGGYEFSMGLGIDVGWRFAREDDVRDAGVGALLSYTVAF